MDDKAAEQRLRLLEKEPGALKIITPFHACSDEPVLDTQVAAAGPDSELAKRCSAHADRHGHRRGQPGGYFSVGHYRLEDVKSVGPLEGSKSGRWRAVGVDGSTCSNLPGRLLDRLTEHERT